MTDQQQGTYFAYPLKGLGVLAIFLFFGPALQAIVGVCLQHDWVGGDQLLIEFFAVLQNEALHAILPSYSQYMPSSFIAGAWLALRVSTGAGLSLSATIGRTLVAFICVELVIDGILLIAGVKAHTVVIYLLRAVIQAIICGWGCWLLSRVFKLDKPVVANNNG